MITTSSGCASFERPDGQLDHALVVVGAGALGSFSAGMPNSSTAGTPSAWAAPASSTAWEIDSRSTPGMASIGVRLSSPSSTNIGCTRCAGVSSVSRTMSRSSPVRRSRRIRVAGKAIDQESRTCSPVRRAPYARRVRHLRRLRAGPRPARASWREISGVLLRARGEHRGLADDDPARALRDDALVRGGARRRATARRWPPTSTRPPPRLEPRGAHAPGRGRRWRPPARGADAHRHGLRRGPPGHRPRRGHGAGRTLGGTSRTSTPAWWTSDDGDRSTCS